jgi:hypothetical protein
MLEPRRAVFYNYHDPDVRLQREDVELYRYHPLLLNASFLGGLTAEDHRILGFGNKTNYNATWERPVKHGFLQNAFLLALNTQLWASKYQERIIARLKRTLNAS